MRKYDIVKDFFDAESSYEENMNDTNLDGIKVYLNEINVYQMLSPSAENEVVIKAKNGDKEARNKLIKSNLRLVVFVAKKYYEINGNLFVPRKYLMEVDGKVYDIGSWLNVQRRVFSGLRQGILTSKQIYMLNEIGMLWDLKYKDRKKRLLEKEKNIIYKDADEKIKVNTKVKK